LGILLCFLAVIGGVSEVNSQKNFANVFEAQVFIENTLQLQELHIKQQIPYSTIYSSLEKQCPALALSNAKALAETLKQSRTTNIRPQALKSEMERRFTMLKNIIPAMKATDETLFCTQKYLTYTLLEHTQNLYYGKTAPSKASTTTPQKSQTPSLVQPPVEQVLESTHASADTSETPQYLHFTHHQNTLPNSAEASFTQVTDLYLQQEI
jgi:predicted transcriptional regulator